MSGIAGTSHSKSKIIGRSQDTAKAWVHWDGTSTSTISQSFNVSSITDTGSGDQTVNFITPMKTANYIIVSTGVLTQYGNTDWGAAAPRRATINTALPVGSVRLDIGNNTATSAEDVKYCAVVIFGD